MGGAVAGQTDASVFAPVNGQIYAAPSADQTVYELYLGNTGRGHSQT